ncbi:MAG: Hsp20/alpha crystallin family protein [Synergistaceae bacterium]|jgi:HSP20 family protein|nr:Hsp20/alpha crystallin family protein [Synergistaceae bacterium]
MAALIPFNRKYSVALPVGFEDFHNMLDDFFSEGPGIRRNLARDTFKLDVEETPEEFKIQAELPGVRKEEINLELNEGKLTISVKKEENVAEEKKNYIHRERRLSSMARSIYLGDARAEGIRAKLEDGILTVVVTKEQKADKVVSISID